MKRCARRTIRPAIVLVLILAGVNACSDGHREPESAAPAMPAVEPSSEATTLGEALTFHASFDTGPDADFSAGDPTLYTAASYDEQDQATPGIGNPEIEIAGGVGRFGDALRFNARNQHAVFYRAEANVAYAADDWNGTVSFWLSLDPAVDLEPGFCDPIQITATAFNDAAIWVDFTRENPRQFRLGLFGDLDVWNPDALASADHPWFLDRLIVVDDPPYATGRWTHVVITYSGLNTEGGGTANLYLDGVPQPKTVTGIAEPFTWDLARAAIRLGVNYVGLLDEISMFNRALSAAEVRLLHELERGVAELHP